MQSSLARNWTLGDINANADHCLIADQAVVGLISCLPGPRLRNDLYCVEWDIKLYYTTPPTTDRPQ